MWIWLVTPGVASVICVIFLKQEAQPSLTLCCWLRAREVMGEDSLIWWYFQPSCDASLLSDNCAVKQIIMASCGRHDNHQSPFFSLLIDTGAILLCSGSISYFSLWGFPIMKNTASHQSRRLWVWNQLSQVSLCSAKIFIWCFHTSLS